jgi:hypothetical protein
MHCDCCRKTLLSKDLIWQLQDPKSARATTDVTNRGPCQFFFLRLSLFLLHLFLLIGIKDIVFVVIYVSSLYCQPNLTTSGAPATHLNQSKQWLFHTFFELIHLSRSRNNERVI